MSAPDFRELLAKPVDDITRPPPLPAGTYYGTISGFKFQKSRWNNQETGEPDLQVSYGISGISPGDDVAPELLEGVKLDKKLFADLPLSGGNEYVTKEFLSACGIATSGRGFGELCPEAQGKEVMFEIVHSPNKTDPTAPPNVNIRKLRARPAA